MQTKFYQEGFKIGTRNPDRWPEVCSHRKQSLELNQVPHLKSLELRAADLKEKEEEIQRQIPPDADPPPIKKGWICFFAGLVLFVASFAMLSVSLEPFRMGFWAYLISAGAAVATTTVTHFFFLYLKQKEKLPFRISAIFLGLLLIVHFGMGVERVSILKKKSEYAGQGSVIINNSSQTKASDGAEEPKSKFYRFLFIALPLLSVAFEIAAGMAFHAAVEIILHKARVDRQRLTAVRRKMMVASAEYAYRQNLPKIFEEEFSAGARQAAAELGRRNNDDSQANLITIVIIAIILLCIVAAYALADEPKASTARTKFLILLDLSKSRDRKGYDGLSDFEKDVSSIAERIAAVPAGSRVTIIGITQNSFASPYILLDAQVSSDPGYLDEYLTAARRRLVTAWKQNSKNLKPAFQTTDLFGALAIASQLRGTGNGRTTLIIYSDMQQDDNGSFDFDKAKTIPPEWIMKAEKHGLITQLKEMNVYCLGATSGQKSIAYWRSLQEFWIVYFKKSGAQLGTFTISRDFPFESLGGVR